MALKNSKVSAKSKALTQQTFKPSKASDSAVGAPSQHNQGTRKGKRAWRKNIDIDEIEDGLEGLRTEERVTGYVSYSLPEQWKSCLMSFCHTVLFCRKSKTMNYSKLMSRETTKVSFTSRSLLLFVLYNHSHSTQTIAKVFDKTANVDKSLVSTVCCSSGLLASYYFAKTQTRRFAKS